MKKRISDKINDLKDYLKQLMVIKPDSLKKYVKDFKTRAACERYFERIAEAVLDISILIIKDKGLHIPDDDNEYFNLLGEKNIIDFDLVKKLKEMRGMRNIIAHQYGNLDDELVYMAINDELEDDIKKFIKIIDELLNQEE